MEHADVELSRRNLHLQVPAIRRRGTPCRDTQGYTRAGQEAERARGQCGQQSLLWFPQEGWLDKASKLGRFKVGKSEEFWWALGYAGRALIVQYLALERFRGRRILSRLQEPEKRWVEVWIQNWLFAYQRCAFRQTVWSL